MLFSRSPGEPRVFYEAEDGGMFGIGEELPSVVYDAEEMEAGFGPSDQSAVVEAPSLSERVATQVVAWFLGVIKRLLGK